MLPYLDFDIEIGKGIRQVYPVAARSSAGEAQGLMRFPLNQVALQTSLMKLQNALLQRALLKSGSTQRKVLTPDEEAVQDFGRRLFDTLMDVEVRSLYDRSRDKAIAEKRSGVRLRLHVQPPHLAALPWEYLYDPRVPDYICLSRRTPLVRYVETSRTIQPLPIELPLRILGMIANPSDLEPLAVERERERMHLALEPLKASEQVELTWLEGQTQHDLQQAMRGGPWHVFHFIGHGDFDIRHEEGVLALANEQGKTALLYATQLARLLADHDPLRLVILNACNGAKGSQRDNMSSAAATLSLRGIPAVLAMQDEVTDDAAVELTKTFYETLAEGWPVDTAVTEARVAIAGVNNSLEWGMPVLYMRSTDGVLFNLDKKVNLARNDQKAIPTITNSLTDHYISDEQVRELPDPVLGRLLSETSGSDGNQLAISRGKE